MTSMLDYDESRLAVLSWFVRRGVRPSSLREPQDQSAVHVDERLPRLPFASAFGDLGSGGDDGSSGDKSNFIRLLRRHGYVILTGVHGGAALYRSLEVEMMGTVCEEATAAAATQQRGFFTSAPPGSRAKTACTGEVYESERGVPMWHCGYEHVEDKVREAFRVHAAGAPPPSSILDDSSSSSSSPLRFEGFELRWPSATMKMKWQRLVAFCHGLTDAALAAALTDASGAGSSSSSSQTRKVTTAAEVTRIRSSALRIGEDYSVAYALHYPNEEGGAPTLPPSVTAGRTNVPVKVSLGAPVRRMKLPVEAPIFFVDL